MHSFLPSPPPPPSFSFWFSFHFSRDQNRKLIPFHGLFLLRTKRKRLLRRLDSVACVSSFDEGASVDTSGFCTGFSSEFSVPCAICTSTTRLRKLWKVKNLIVIWLWIKLGEPQSMILTLSTYLYSYQPLLKQNDDKNRIIIPLPDSELYGRKRKKSMTIHYLKDTALILSCWKLLCCVI